MSITFFEFPDPILWWHVVFVGSVFWLGSMIIGLFGVAGGVLFVPALLQLPGAEPSFAVGTQFVSSIAMAWIRCAQLQYYKRCRWRAACPMMIGCVFTCIPSQLLVKHTPKWAVITLVALVALYAGFMSIRQTQAAKRAAARARARKAEKIAEAEAVDSEQANATQAAELVAEEPDAEVVAPEPATDTIVDIDNWCNQSADIDDLSNGEDRVGSNPISPKTLDSKPSIQSRASTSSKFIRAEGQVRVGMGTSEVPGLKVGRELSRIIDKSPLEDAADKAATPQWVNDLRYFGIGLVGGAISSVGGIGGPVVIMPLHMLVMPPIDMKLLIGVMNPAATSIVTSSAISALAIGEVDLGWALLLAVIGTVGVLTGGYLQERMSSLRLKEAVGYALIFIAIFMLVKTIVDEVS